MMDVEFHVTMLGKTWSFHGFGAITELAHAMDRLCSDSRSDQDVEPPILGGRVTATENSRRPTIRDAGLAMDAPSEAS